MKYTAVNNKIIMTEFDSFNIKEILECGQCFQFTPLNENSYVIVAFNRILHIDQYPNCIEFYPCSKKDFQEIWIDYFDLNNDYSKIKLILSKDEILKQAIEYAPGIRILNQEPFECLISFIISQNNRIPMIKQVIKNISEKYGTKASDYYLFPTLNQLKSTDTDSLMSCKTGFRARYILDAIDKLSNSTVDMSNFSSLPTEAVKNELLKITGVGSKVADCVLLFSLRRKEVFPTDVWIKRVMEHFYFNDSETSIKAIHAFAKDKWGDYAGYAQQYLFYYARTLQIGKK